MVDAGVAVPTPVLAVLLIDTGASCTCIDPATVSPLNLQPTGATQFQTPSTNGVHHSCNLYDISLLMPAPRGTPFFVPALPIVETHLRSQGIDGLIGRDLLKQWTLYYNGQVDQICIAY